MNPAAPSIKPIIKVLTRAKLRLSITNSFICRKYPKHARQDHLERTFRMANINHLDIDTFASYVR